MNISTSGGVASVSALASKEGVLTPIVAVDNAPVKFRDALEAFNTVDRWRVVNKNALDILSLEGNVASASYLTISKDPLNDNHETIIESIDTFEMPFRIGIGASMSQRIQGQEFSVEAVSVDDPSEVTLLTPVGAQAVQNISQTTTVLTVNFLTAHGLLPGDRFSVYGSNFRVNYPMLTVASVTANGLGLTATAGPQGTIPSQTVGPFTSGSILRHDPLGYARNGMSYLFEGTTAQNNAYFARSEGGSAYPSGAILGNHSISFGNTTAIALVSGARAFSFSPTMTFEMMAQIEAISWFPTTIDNVNTTATAQKRTQVIPNPARKYKIRIRAKTLPSFTDVNARIVSAVKTASTTATITTDAPHGLTTGDLVQIYGIRDQTGFQNLTTSGAITVTGANTFTVVIGSSATVTSYGGFVSKVNAQLIGGITTNVIQNVVRTNNLLTLTLLATSTGVAVGDLVNLVGVTNNTNGTNLGVDGAYRVVDGVGTTSLVLEPVVVILDGVSGNYAPTGADIASVAATGGIIKRTDFRLHFLRVMQFTRHLVEITGGAQRNDANGSVPVAINNTASINFSQIGGSTPASVVAAAGTNRLMGVGLGAPFTNIDVASLARTFSANSGVIASDFGAAISGNIVVTAASGTSPTLDIGLEESYDNGTNWVRIWDAPRITGTTAINVPQMQLGGRRRWVWTIGGTTPSFTFAINTMQGSLAAPVLRQSYNRTLDPNTLNSATPAFSIAGCLQITAKVNLTTLGANAAFVMEVSDDGTVWTPVTAPVSPATTGGTMVGNLQVAAQFARIRTSTAGTGAVLGYASITGVN